MTTGRHLLALLRSYRDKDDRQFFSVAMQLAAHEAKQGHVKLAQELRTLIDEAKAHASAVRLSPTGPVPIVQPKGELASLLTVRYSSERLSSMVLTGRLQSKLQRVLIEQHQQAKLQETGLHPRRKLLLIGPPGTGKTMTAAALAGELQLPLFTIQFHSLITKFMGETAGKLRIIFEAMVATRGVYFFDEFDAIGARRASSNDVGEIRRVLNSFLQFLENDASSSVIVAATNHPELLDKALFRRFDDVLEYSLPTNELIVELLKARLASYTTDNLEWKLAAKAAKGLSQSEVAKAADNAAKSAVLQHSDCISTEMLLVALRERKDAVAVMK